MVYEYLLIISPDAEAYLKLAKIKKIFSQKYGCVNAINLKPHITLINFIQTDLAENKIVDQLVKVAKSYYPFTVYLKGFGSFKSQTVFVSVLNGDKILEIVKDIRYRFRKLLVFNKDYPPIFATTPHVTIARGMTEVQYELALSEWKNIEFSSNFQTSSMLLLKRTFNTPYIKVKQIIFTGEHPPGEQLIFPF